MLPLLSMRNKLFFWKQFLPCCCLILLLAFTTGCKNDIKEVQKFVTDDTVAVQTAEGVTMLYSERGEVVFKLISPKIVQRDNKKKETVFPDGLRVIFYDSTGGAIRSELTANYAVKNDRERKIIVTGDVVINNYVKDERLNTEELIWDQKIKKIFTDKFVTITTKDQVIYGEEGLVANESFDDWVINKPKGTLKFKEEEKKK